MSLLIKLPPVFEVNEGARGNTIRKLLLPAATISGTIANFQEGNSKAKAVIPDDDVDQRILLVRKSSSIPLIASRVIRIGSSAQTNEALLSDLREGRWLKHPLMSTENASVVAPSMQLVIDSWKGAFSYVMEDPNNNIKGLRSPQIGAIHNVQGHWTVSDEVATIVMPTGTGKTETMLGVMVSTPCEKVLVVVPTDALRTQLAEKFLTLGILKDKDCHVLKEGAAYPAVGILRHKPRDNAEVDDFFGRCHVIVTTS